MTDNLLLEAAETAVPVLGEVKAGLTLAKALWPLLAALGAAGAVGAGVLYIHHLQADATSARAERDAFKAQAVGAQEKAKATTEVGQIADRGQARTDVTVHLEQEHRNAILSAPGAGQAVDPDLYRALVGGLCAYDAEAGDPRCDQMRRADPRSLPQAGSRSAGSGADGGGDLGGPG